ncbi:uncharacterized protein HMPREF1541_06106 [Cyphellophora europaea CBS 101466]|uniref:Mediator of RNA polymerase II transcription subunit 7 n=1 Tax=Cyphellophora europaea (strain CBS 101466) TaxID=1220924 RepID=W2RUB7_CYPE1|nr:uncharacterized protein HMPREF1541_06106 [Cyphellophora europaea CBS 101466]ETN39880.1 hypothetical protein HMPREF1541_06106 [Cyphellophora europaea CBS 101466]
MVDAQPTADEQQQAQPEYNPLNFLKSPFPAPPPFWKHFSTANISRLSEIQSSTSSSDSTSDLPYDLALLLPPPAPQFGAYPAFSRPNQVHPQADPPPASILLFDPAAPRFNPAVTLTKLTKSLLLNFLELTTIMEVNPSERQDKMEDIRRLVINVHAVINMYRPHQARESVKEMLEGLLEEGRREMEVADAVKEKVKVFLSEVEGLRNERVVGNRMRDHVNGHGNVDQQDDDEDERLTEARRLWRVVHEIAEE